MLITITSPCHLSFFRIIQSSIKVYGITHKYLNKQKIYFESVWRIKYRRIMQEANFIAINMLYLAYGSKEKTNPGVKFLNNYINKKEKQGNKAKNQLYNIKWKSEMWCVCVKPEFIDSHVCYKLRNSLGGYCGIRVVRVSDDLSGSSSRGHGSIVARSAVVTAGGVSKIRQSSDEFICP